MMLVLMMMNTDMILKLMGVTVPLKRRRTRSWPTLADEALRQPSLVKANK